MTKVVLKTFPCLPASDRFFIAGFRSEHFPYSYVNRDFVNRAIAFCHDHLSEQRAEQARIKDFGGVHYPLMKLMDMYFSQIGDERYAAIQGRAAADLGPPE